MTSRRRFITTTSSQFTALAAATLAWPWAAQAQTVDTTRLLVGFPAGGTVDALARRLADKLRGGFAKTALVENKPGAGGRLAVEELKRSAADGTSLLVTPAAMITLYPPHWRLPAARQSGQAAGARHVWPQTLALFT